MTSLPDCSCGHWATKHEEIDHWPWYGECKKCDCEEYDEETDIVEWDITK